MAQYSIRKVDRQKCFAIWKFACKYSWRTHDLWLNEYSAIAKWYSAHMCVNNPILNCSTHFCIHCNILYLLQVTTFILSVSTSRMFPDTFITFYWLVFLNKVTTFPRAIKQNFSTKQQLLSIYGLLSSLLPLFLFLLQLARLHTWEIYDTFAKISKGLFRPHC